MLSEELLDVNIDYRVKYPSRDSKEPLNNNEIITHTHEIIIKKSRTIFHKYTQNTIGQQRTVCMVQQVAQN